MVVFALILLFFANHQPAVDPVRRHGGAERPTEAGITCPGLRASACSWRSSSSTASTPPGRSARRRSTRAGRRPRGVLSSILISGLVGTVFLLGVILAIPSIPDAMAEGQAGGFPIATTIIAVLTDRPGPGITLGELYLFVILASVFVCTLAIQGAATRMMFSMSRDRHLPFGGLWGPVNTTFRTPANAAIAVGVLAALPILVVGPLGRPSSSRSRPPA